MRDINSFLSNEAGGSLAGSKKTQCLSGLISWDGSDSLTRLVRIAGFASTAQALVQK